METEMRIEDFNTNNAKAVLVQNLLDLYTAEQEMLKPTFNGVNSV